MQHSGAKPLSKPKAKGWLSRLASDQKGNTLAIVGAALVPLTAMIGSGIDMSRAYMAKQRLQAACDAASLAGRRAMTNDQLTSAVTTEATKFFNFNFPQGSYQTTSFTPSVTRPSSGVVAVSAATNIPTAIMKIFGFTSLPISVTCDASLNFVNTDVMLVLDTTGSMLWDVNGNTTSVVANQRITALRDAAMALYDELAPVQAQLASAGMRLRYGIVPFSTTVNVGAAIRSKSANYLADSWTYPSRTPIFSTSSAPVRVGTSMNNSTCNTYRQARTPADSYPSTEKIVARPGSGTNRPCDVYTITYTEGSGATFAWWIHEPNVYDTSVYKTGSTTVPLPTRVPGTTTTATAWNGCIEERDTDDNITSATGFTIPSGAHDLDIDLIPTQPEHKWRPMWLQTLYWPSSGTYSTADSNDISMTALLDSNSRACPTEAKVLQTWTRTDFDTYIDSLNPVGYTYHDIGMIWGARMISNGGIFGADNPDTFNGMPVARHIIYMTDGLLDTDRYAYTAYGIEDIDERVTGGTFSEQDARHRQRFRMICNAAKGKNVSIWVIAFATTATAELTECASNSNQISTISNRDALIAKFREIGNNIGALRLTQ
jgi:Flp pilus assembly protein TadG